MGHSKDEIVHEKVEMGMARQMRMSSPIATAKEWPLSEETMTTLTAMVNRERAVMNGGKPSLKVVKT